MTILKTVSVPLFLAIALKEMVHSQIVTCSGRTVTVSLISHTVIDFHFYFEAQFNRNGCVEGKCPHPCQNLQILHQVLLWTLTQELNSIYFCNPEDTVLLHYEFGFMGGIALFSFFFGCLYLFQFKTFDFSSYLNCINISVLVFYIIFWEKHFIFILHLLY